MSNLKVDLTKFSDKQLNQIINEVSQFIKNSKYLPKNAESYRIYKNSGEGLSKVVTSGLAEGQTIRLDHIVEKFKRYYDSIADNNVKVNEIDAIIEITDFKLPKTVANQLLLSYFNTNEFKQAFIIDMVTRAYTQGKLDNIEIVPNIVNGWSGYNPCLNFDYLTPKKVETLSKICKEYYDSKNKSLVNDGTQVFKKLVKMMSIAINKNSTETNKYKLKKMIKDSIGNDSTEPMVITDNNRLPSDLEIDIFEQYNIHCGCDFLSVGYSLNKHSQQVERIIDILSNAAQNDTWVDKVHKPVYNKLVKTVCTQGNAKRFEHQHIFDKLFNIFTGTDTSRRMTSDKQIVSFCKTVLKNHGSKLEEYSVYETIVALYSV